MKHHQSIFQALASTVFFLVSAHAADDVPSANFRGQVLSIQMIDGQTGWATGESSHSAALLQTHDGGKSWTDISPRPLRSKESVQSNDASGLISFCLLDAKDGWAAFAEDPVEGHGPTMVFSTGDGGRSWQHSSFKTSVGGGGITSIEFTDRAHGFILVESDSFSGKCYKATCRTSDGGRIWQTTSEHTGERDIGDPLPGEGFTNGMVFRNANDGWIVGSPRGDDNAFFFRTRDGGKSWEPQTLKPPQGFSTAYSALVHIPWFFGDKKADGVLSATFLHWTSHKGETDFYATRDGGEHWRRVGNAPAEMEGNSDGDPVCEVFVDGKHGWRANTADGQLFATADGAATWQKVESDLRLGDNEAVSQIDFVNLTQGWLIKDISKEKAEDVYELLRTTDGGHTWVHCFGPEGAAAHP